MNTENDEYDVEKDTVEKDDDEYIIMIMLMKMIK